MFLVRWCLFLICWVWGGIKAACDADTLHYIWLLSHWFGFEKVSTDLGVTTTNCTVWHLPCHSLPQILIYMGWIITLYMLISMLSVPDQRGLVKGKNKEEHYTIMYHLNARTCRRHAVSLYINYLAFCFLSLSVAYWLASWATSLWLFLIWIWVSTPLM